MPSWCRKVTSMSPRCLGGLGTPRDWSKRVPAQTRLETPTFDRSRCPRPQTVRIHGSEGLRIRVRVWVMHIPDTTCLGLPGRTAAPDRPPWHHPWPFLGSPSGSPRHVVSWSSTPWAQHPAPGLPQTAAPPNPPSEPGDRAGS